MTFDLLTVWPSACPAVFLLDHIIGISPIYSHSHHRNCDTGQSSRPTSSSTLSNYTKRSVQKYLGVKCIYKVRNVSQWPNLLRYKHLVFSFVNFLSFPFSSIALSVSNPGAISFFCSSTCAVRFHSPRRQRAVVRRPELESFTLRRM